MKPAVHHRWFQALMGSPFTIEAYVAADYDKNMLEKMVRLAFGEVARLEDLMTDFRASPVTEINKMAGIKPVAVSQELFEIISQSIKFSAQTGGAFDITYASVGHLWREAMKLGTPPTPCEIEAAKKLIGYEKVLLNVDTHEVFLPEQGMKIGLGGIGKGYAVDRAFELLRNLGLKNFYINGAGDIHTHSLSEAPRPWRIGIRNPLAPKDQAMGYLKIANGAVATSGDYERFFRHNNKKYHHVINARNGEITDDVCSATVLASSTLVADVYATTSMAMGSLEGIKFLNSQPGISGFLVNRKGKVIKTESLN